jgi:hypothetical protein
LKRNGQRLRIALKTLFSFGDRPWVSVRFISHCRRWDQPLHSVMGILLGAWILVYSPMWLLPVNLYAITLATSLVSYLNRNKRSFVIWNQEIVDPDDSLTALQKINKIIYMVEYFELRIGQAADIIEKIVNSLNFADERVTVAVLLVLLVFATTLSFLLVYLPLGQIIFIGYVICMLPPYFRAKIFSSNLKKKTEISSTTSRRPRAANTGNLGYIGRFRRKISRALAMITSIPRQAINVFKRVPTSDELGHRFIAMQQQCSGETFLREDRPNRSRNRRDDGEDDQDDNTDLLPRSRSASPPDFFLFGEEVFMGGGPQLPSSIPEEKPSLTNTEEDEEHNQQSQEQESTVEATESQTTQQQSTSTNEQSSTPNNDNDT